MTREELLQTAKPILFNTEMVKAILDGHKTMTRRVMKFPVNKFTGEAPMHDDVSFYNTHCNENTVKIDIKPHYCMTIKVPYCIGDILYVRETWQNVFETEYDPEAEECYVNIRTRIKNFDDIPKVEAGISREDSCSLMKPRMKYFVYKASDIQYADEEIKLIWRSPIYMPKAAARIFLRVTDVRVERLQECGKGWCIGIEHDALREEFQKLWDSTIKKSDLAIYGWSANPWVWVIEFERIEVE